MGGDYSTTHKKKLHAQFMKEVSIQIETGLFVICEQQCSKKKKKKRIDTLTDIRSPVGRQ